MGTPHRGSEKASYGQVLERIATTVMNKPRSSLLTALKSNSNFLMQLTTDFRHQFHNFQVFSFYELEPMKGFLTLMSFLYTSLLPQTHCSI